MHHFARRTAGLTVALTATGLVVAGCAEGDDDAARPADLVLTGAAAAAPTPGGEAGAPGAVGAEETRIVTADGEITVSGDIYHKFVRSGGPAGPLGLPLGAEESGPDAGEYQHFAGGTIYAARGAEPYIVWGEIRKAWEEIGGAKGKLGHPISDEYDIPGGKRSDFAGGIIMWVDGDITIRPKL
ncbi:LGFP repeat-containing protein [Nocardia sp. CNY236]|uniref:LGFP repeat-containing protein n=1 Tax=Nocardia sp. CNY236 TaxID=1169152 RepID=UPI000410A821|nr:esterase [Nocardia sp. CNY236]